MIPLGRKINLLSSAIVAKKIPPALATTLRERERARQSNFSLSPGWPIFSFAKLLFRKHTGDDWRKIDGFAAGVAGDDQHQLPRRLRLLLLRLAHHQEEPRHQATPEYSYTSRMCHTGRPSSWCTRWCGPSGFSPQPAC